MKRLVIALLILTPTLCLAQMIPPCEVEKAVLKDDNAVLTDYADGLLNTRTQVEKLVSMLRLQLAKAQNELAALKKVNDPREKGGKK